MQDRPSRFTPIATFMLSVVVVLAVVSIAMRSHSTPRAGSVINDYIGRPAPEFTLPDLDGNAVSLASLKGKVVVLDLWATWCPPCIEELPIVTGITAKYADRGVTYKAVNVGDSPAQVRAFLAKAQISPPVLLDEKYHVGELYGAQYIPLLVVIDRSGRIVAHGNVAPDEVEKTLPEWIESALKSGQAS